MPFINTRIAAQTYCGQTFATPCVLYADAFALFLFMGFVLG